jgi:hypothetical protein
MGDIMPSQIPYSRMNPKELRDLEAEFGRPLTPELAQWLLRARMNRQAVELMIGEQTQPQASQAQESACPSRSAAARR